jgi:Type I phosphodiesterase / nucleotide pyrophosphatase
MTRALIVLLALVSIAGAPAATQGLRDGSDVRLVLLIAVDQLRYDYLTRFRGEFTGGFRRLLDEGAVFTDAHLEHYPTVTAVGHSTMLSGATPSVSGIIGNDWFDRQLGRSIQSVTDDAVQPVGAASGAASPRRLLVTTVGDELKLASAAPRGSTSAPRAIGISIKDRSAILPVGRGADAAYWMESASGRFVSSTYYMKDAPGWVQAFNDQRPLDAFAGRAWTALAPPSGVLLQLPTEPGPRLHDAVLGSPFGNDLLLDFASQALSNEQLGQRGAIDLLSVSFSSNDLVGHAQGPESAQVHDITVRTDRVIGQLLERVDKLVGLRHVIVALTADHGVSPVPERLAERSLPGGRLTRKELFAPMEQALASRFGAGQWVLGTAGSSPYLNDALMTERQLDPTEVRRVAADALMAVPHVARVYTRDQLMRGEVGTDRVGQRVLRGFNAQRSGDLEVILEPFWISGALGTTHGSPYNYDTHIPLVLMGPRVKRGTYSDHAALNDLAPTLATLLEVETPSGSSGRVLSEALLPRGATAP